MIHRAWRWTSREQLFAGIRSISAWAASDTGAAGSAGKAVGDARVDAAQDARNRIPPSGVETWADDVLRGGSAQPGLPADKRLTELPFHLAKRWQDVRRMLEDLSQAPDIYNIEAALVRLKKLPDPPPREFLDQLLRGVLDLLPIQTLRLRNFANILHACFRLGYMPEDVLGTLAQELTKRTSTQFWTFPLVVFTLGTIRGRQSGQASTELFPGQGDVLEEVGPWYVNQCTVRSLSTRQLSNLLHGLARLQGPTAPLLDPVLKSLVEVHLKDVMADDKTAPEVLWSLARLQADKKYVRPILSAFETAVKGGSMLAMFSDRGIATITYSLGKLGHRSGYLECELLKEVTDRAIRRRFTERQIANIWYGLAGIGVRDPSLLQALAEETAAEDRLSRYTHQGVSMILSSLGRLQYGDKTLVLRLLARVGHGQHLAGCSERDIANLVFSVGNLKLGTDSVPCIQVLVAELKSRRSLHQWTEQELSIVFYGLVKANVREADFMAFLVQEIIDRVRIGNLSSQRILSFMVGFAKLFGSKPPDCGGMPLILARELCKTHRLQQLFAKDLVSFLGAAARLNLEDSSIIDLILDEIGKRNRRSYSARDLYCIVYSMRRAGGVDPSLLDAVLATLTSAEYLSNITQHHLANIVFHVGQIGTGNTVRIDALLEKIVCTGLDTFTDSQLARILYGVGHLQHFKSASMSEIVQEFCSSRRLVAAEARDLAHVFFAMGHLGYGGTAAAKALVQEITAPQRTKEFHPVGLSMMIQALVPMKCTSGHVVGMLVKEVGKRHNLERFTDADLSSIVRVFACLGIRDEQCLQAVTNELFTPDRVFRMEDKNWMAVIRGLAMLDFRHAEALGFFSQLLGAGRLCRMEPQVLGSLSTFVAEYAKRAEEAKAVSASRIVAVLLAPRTITRLTAPQVAAILWGFWRTGHMTTDAMNAAIDRMTHPNILPQVSEMHMATLVHGVGALPSMSHARLSNRVTRVVLDSARLCTFSPGGLLSVLQCYHSSREADSAALFTVFAELLKPHRLNALSTEEAVSAVRHLVRLRWRGDGLQRLLHRATGRGAQGDLTELHIAVLASSLAECKLYDEEFLNLLAGVARDGARLKRFSAAGLQTVILFLGALGVRGGVMDCFIEDLLRPSRLAGMSQADVLSAIRAVRLVGKQDAFDVEGLIRASLGRAISTCRQLQ